LQETRNEISTREETNEKVKEKLLFEDMVAYSRYINP